MSDDPDMNNIVDRAAIALATAYGEQVAATWQGQQGYDYRKMARAVIEAIREPTNEMIEASWEATKHISYDERMAVALMSSKNAHKVKMLNRYSAMIDAALAASTPKFPAAMGMDTYTELHGSGVRENEPLMCSGLGRPDAVKNQGE